MSRGLLVMDGVADGGDNVGQFSRVHSHRIATAASHLSGTPDAPKSDTAMRRMRLYTLYVKLGRRVTLTGRTP